MNNKFPRSKRCGFLVTCYFFVHLHLIVSSSALAIMSLNGGNGTNSIHNPLAAGFITTFVVVVVVTGTFGNLLTLFTIVRVKCLRTTTFALVANLALIDTCVVLLVIPLTLSRYFFMEFYEEHRHVCKALGHLLVLIGTVSINTVQVIAANRYFIVTQPRHIYLKIWKRSNTVIIVVLTWSFCFILTCLPLFGFGEVDYIPELGGCFIAESTQLTWWYKTILFLNVIESCGIVTPIFLILTFLKIRSTRRRIQCTPSIANRFNLSVRPQGMSQVEIAVTKMVALMFFCFLFCWCPSFIFHIATIGKVKSVGAVTVLAALACSNSVINPFIYVGMNTKIRRAICQSVFCNDPTRSSAVNTIS